MYLYFSRSKTLSDSNDIQVWHTVIGRENLLINTCKRPMPNKALTAILILGGSGAFLLMYQNAAIKRTVLSA